MAVERLYFSHLAAIFQLVYDLLLYGSQIVLHVMFREEVIRAPRFIRTVSRRLAQGNRKLCKVDRTRVCRTEVGVKSVL